MITKNDLLARRDEIIAVAKRHGASKVRIFGSVARGDNEETSDIDLVVRFAPGRSLFDHGGLIADLEDLLGAPVDVVSENGMRERVRERVLQDAVPL